MMDLPKGWKRINLDNLCLIKGRIGYRGYTKQDIVAKGNGAITLSPSNIKDNQLHFENNTYISWEKYFESPEIMVDIGDIIYCKTASIGKMALVKELPEKATLNPQFVVLKNINCDREFLYYYMNSNPFLRDIEKIIGGTAIPTLSQSNLGRIDVPIPPIDEQHRIVSILNTAFSAIDRAKANLEKNLQNAKDLFQSELNRIFSEKGDDWEEMKVSEICKLINGRAYKKTELLENGKYRVLRVGNFFTNDHWYYSDLELASDKYCNNQDLLYAWSASFGPRLWLGEKVIYHYHIWKIQPDSKTVSKEYLFHLLDWDKDQIKSAHGTGTTMIHVSKGSMENRIVPIAPLKQQNQIVERINRLKEKSIDLQSSYTQKLLHLESLKKSILQKAFTGQLTSNRHSLQLSPKEIHAGILALSYKEHLRRKRLNTFHHVKSEKIVHVVENLCHLNLERKPIKAEFGPNDFQTKLAVQDWAESEKIFSFKPEGKFYEFRPLENFEGFLEKVRAYFEEKLSDIVFIIEKFISSDTKESEIITTVFAAWNNLLILGHETSPESIVTEARENWHESKMKINREDFFKAITTLRDKNLIPDGTGKLVTAKI